MAKDIKKYKIVTGLSDSILEIIDMRLISWNSPRKFT